MDQLLYTIPQCCRLAAIGRTKFYELVASGEIPIRKVGKKTLVAAADLKRWAERLPCRMRTASRDRGTEGARYLAGCRAGRDGQRTAASRRRAELGR
jgi:excisionase family DNA binding protein